MTACLDALPELVQNFHRICKPFTFSPAPLRNLTVTQVIVLCRIAVNVRYWLKTDRAWPAQENLERNVAMLLRWVGIALVIQERKGAN